MNNRVPAPITPFIAALPRTAGHLLQRKCGCGQHTIAGGKCSGCAKEGSLQRRAAGAESMSGIPPLVHEVINSPGEPLDTSTRAFMEPRFGQDFSRVRVHMDSRASESARAVNASAYTVGQNIVFTNQMFRPGEVSGRQLLAHELTHVMQQRSGPGTASMAQLSLGAHDSPLESEAENIAATVMQSGLKAPLRPQATNSTPLISRADPDAVGHTMTLGRAARTGLQFYPTNVTDTRIGVVSVAGGLLGDAVDRLNVIVAENLTPRTLARQLLPLWITATPFTPAGAAAPIPLTIITEDELAKGLLVYNRYYLPVPSMTDWRAGLRFPLPVEIDVTTGMATLNAQQIQALATAFDPTWTPLLDMRAPATTAVPAATLTADVTAFLARQTRADARGLHLGVMASTNVIAALPFIRETFRQLGAGGFDVALAFVDNLLEPALRMIAHQRDGTAILLEVGNVLATAPVPLTPSQQASADRINVAIIVSPQTAPPAAARARPEKAITVDTVKLDGSTHNPATDVAMADAIFSQCNVRVRHGVNQTATNLQTTGWLNNTDLHSANNCSGPSGEERALFRGASATFGFSARFRAFFPATFTGVNGSGYSCIPSDSPAALMRNTAVVQNDGDTDSLAHELGHILIDLGPHTATGLMSGRPALPDWRVDEILDSHCTRLYNHA